MVCTTPQDQRAYALFREAECLECEGNPARAAQLYQQAGPRPIRGVNGLLFGVFEVDIGIDMLMHAGAGRQAVKMSPALAAVYGL